MPVCSPHHTPTPLDTVVRSANGTIAVPAPALMSAEVAVLTAAVYDTIAATLVAETTSEDPAVTLKHGNVRKVPLVDREGTPSWSYSQVEEETADRVQALTVPLALTDPTTGIDCTRFPAVEYSSTYTACATPDTIAAAPSPTRTTAKLVDVNCAAPGSAKRARRAHAS